MNIGTLSTVAALVTTTYVIDKQMESTLSQINRLEAKQSKTPDDRDQLKYLREELQRS